MHRQVEIKAEQIARMIVKGMPGTKIAIEMGMSYDGLQRILKQPEYLEIEQRIRTGVTAKMDARLDKRAEMSDEVEDAVPEAMSVLLDAVRKKRDLKAALELLDRDPGRQFAKARPGAMQPLFGGASAAASTGPLAGVLPREALTQAVRDADLTHSILQNAANKPAEA
jgi:hypothetical protein